MSGYLVHGSNGEFAYLSNKERVDVIRVVKEEVGGLLFLLWCSALSVTLNHFPGRSRSACSGRFWLRVDP